MTPTPVSPPRREEERERNRRNRNAATLDFVLSLGSRGKRDVNTDGWKEIRQKILLVPLWRERERGIETQRLSISFFLSVSKIKREQIEMDYVEENIYSIILPFSDMIYFFDFFLLCEGTVAFSNESRPLPFEFGFSSNKKEQNVIPPRSSR